MMNRRHNSSNDRTGMSGIAWSIVVGVLEILGDIIKGIIVIGGVVAANLADITMGAIATSILFGGSLALLSDIVDVKNWQLGTMISAGASAIQIALWASLMRRGITLRDFWKVITGKAHRDARAFVLAAVVIWVADTFMDVSPLFLLSENSRFMTIDWLYKSLMVSMGILIVGLCGFSEVLTSNLRSMLNVDELNLGDAINNFRPKPSSQSSYRPQASGQNNTSRREEAKGDAFEPVYGHSLGLTGMQAAGQTQGKKNKGAAFSDATKNFVRNRLDTRN